MSKLIDADALKEQIESHVTTMSVCQNKDERCGMVRMKETCIEDVENAPTVDAVPVVHGRWTERHVDYVSDCAIDEVQTAKCSVCGLYHTTPYLYSFKDYNFCPSCGARMGGELG